MNNKWDQRYSEPDYVYGTAANDFLVQSLPLLPPNGSVLCLAEGEGRNAVFLAERGYQVTAVDSSMVGLAKARALAGERRVAITTCVADLADYQLPQDSFDLIVAIFCHLPPPLRRQVLAQVEPSLRRGGVFLLEGYTPKQLEYGTGGPPDPALLMQLDELRRELAPLRLRHGMELVREVREGKLHTGKGAVVQVIADKV
jgi:SAM-dependent methyltransferase